jgi:hypothetical protein
MVAIGYAEHQPKKDEMAIGIPSGGAPSQIQALVEVSDPSRIGGFRLRNEADEDMETIFCARGAVVSFAGEVVGPLGSQTYTGLLAHKNVVPGTLVITEAAGEVFTDNGDGTLTGSAGGTGTIDYDTGAYSVTFNAVTVGAVTADYDSTGWVDLAAPAPFTLVGGGGASYTELLPAGGDAYADGIKGHNKLGIRGYTTGTQGTQLRVSAIHFGDDSEVKLQEPPELRGEGT